MVKQGKEKALIEQIMETSPVGILIMDMEGHITFANYWAEQVLGLSKGEISKRAYNAPVWHITDYDGNPFPEKKLPFNRVISTGQAIYDVQHAIEWPDGRRVFLSINAAPLFDDAGRVEGVVSIVEDNTRRAMTERKLRDSENRFRISFENSVIGKALTSPDGRFLKVNHAFCEMLGYSEEELTSRHFEEITHPDDIGTSQECAKDLLKGTRDICHLEKRYLRKDGQVVWVTIGAFLYHDEKGNPQFFINDIQDITEQKKVKGELLEKDYLLSESQRVAGIGSWVWDLISTRLLWTPEMYRIYGVSADTFTPTTESFLGLIHSDDRDAMLGWIRAGLGGERPGELEFRIILPDGAIRVILGRGDLEFDAHDKPIRMVGTAQDITERKKLEERLRHTQKMEAIGQLVAGIAHDFNNILTAIIGFGEILRMRIKSEDPLMVNVEHIIESGERGANLTQSLLAYGRKQEIHPAPVNIFGIINRVIKLLSRLLGENIEIKFTTSDEGLMIMADSLQIEQVLMNLANNARDAMPDGGVLTIETSSGNIDMDFIRTYGYGEPREYVILTVSDTGSGMEQMTRERIFDPFFTTKDVGKGAGLGLSIVYGIVKQHNGYINVYSEAGRGTTFKIYLPLFKGKSEGRAPAKDFPTVTGTETVLVAEDDEKVRKLARTLL